MRMNSGNAYLSNLTMLHSNHLFSSLSQAMTNSFSRQSTGLNAWNKERLEKQWKTALIGKSMQSNFTGHSTWKSLYLNYWNLVIAYGQFHVYGMQACSSPNFTTLPCKRCPKTTAEQWETPQMHSYLTTRGFSLLTFSLTLRTHLVPIDYLWSQIL